jgi:cytochrome oxidase assembly protein ShyY1
MARIGQEDPMMESGRKYWLMVERGWLPNETSEYVSRIFAYQVMAENPERFGFDRP